MNQMKGKRFGKWEVIEEGLRDRHGNRRWKCRCDCGAVSVVYQNALRGGKSTRCGLCSRRATTEVRAASLRTHGLSNSPEYKVWVEMVRRCTKPNDPSYPRYGGRGVTVFCAWVGPGGFDVFIEHVGRRPDPKATIDRIDNERGYEPGNVRWASQSDQQRNRRSNRMITFGGHTMPLVAWSEKTGVKRETIAYRIKRGWPLQKALYWQGELEED